MGYFNAKIGVRNTNDKMNCTGPFVTGNRNERGERLLDFAERKQPNSIKLTLLQSSKQILDMGSSRRCDQKPN